MQKNTIPFILTVLIISLLIGCGGGSSSFNPVVNPTMTATPTERPVGILNVQTDMPGKWAELQTFENSALAISLYYPYQEKELDPNGEASFSYVPINTVCSVVIYEDQTKATILASKNINFNADGQTEAINQGTIEPTPTGVPVPTPTITPSPTPSPTTPITPEDKRVVAYFVQWGIYARNYLVTDIPADKVTHINYAFMGIDGVTGTCKMFDPWADVNIVFTGQTAKGFPDQTWEESARDEAGNLGRLIQLKNLYPNIKTLMSIGGYSLSTYFPNVSSTASSRETFVTSCVELMVRYEFDGIDIDWEYPGPSDKTNFTLLLQEFREQLDRRGTLDNKHYLLSVAGPAGYDKLVNIDLAAISNYIDYMNIMTYDYHGPSWENSTNHLAPLYQNPLDPTNPTDREILNVDWTVNYYINSGIPADKLNMGVPFYGYAWEEVANTNNGLFVSAPSAPETGQPGNWERGVLDYWKVNELLSSGDRQLYRDDSAKVPWLYGENMTAGKTEGGLFVTFEDPVSLSGKIDYLQEKGLGGIMFWELSGDIRDSSSSDSLLNVISNEL